MASGIVTPEYAWKQMHNVNPDDMDKSFEKWKVANDPNLQQALMQYAMGEAMGAVNKRMQAEGVSGQMSLPGFGAPGQAGGQQGFDRGNMTTDTQEPPNLQANALNELRTGRGMNAFQSAGGGGAKR